MCINRCLYCCIKLSSSTNTAFKVIHANIFSLVENVYLLCYVSHATASAAGMCRKADVKCVDTCVGKAFGNYHSCKDCTKYVSCVGDTMYPDRPCPGNQAWDDDVKRCVVDSKTCGPCDAVTTSEYSHFRLAGSFCAALSL